MYRAMITPKSDKATQVTNQYGNEVQVLRTEDNGQTLFIETQNNQGQRWYGSMSSNEVEVVKQPNEPLTQREQRLYEGWKQRLAEQEKQNRLRHQMEMLKHKKKKRK